MKKIIFATLLALLLPLCAQAQTFEPCAKTENDLVYENNNGGSDDVYSVQYELKLAQFVDARYDSPSYWRYVFMQQFHESFLSDDTQDILSWNGGRNVLNLPKWVTLYVYEKKDLSKTQLDKLNKLKNGNSNQYEVTENDKQIAVLSTSETLNSRYLKDFYGDFFPKIQQCGEERYVAFAQYSEI